jgi:tetratricopeptide (TPR) repeat protein
LALFPLVLGLIVAVVTFFERLPVSSRDGGVSANSPASMAPAPAAPVANPATAQLDEALSKVNAVIQADPKNAMAYCVRGTIYADEKRWDEAREQYEKALVYDGANPHIKMSLADLFFLQKNYDEARAGYVALEQAPEVDELAGYKVFLCDLFAGHEDAAAGELAAFNEAGSNASYYFANAAWSLYNHKTDDARRWLTSASFIFAPDKFRAYAVCLEDLGYQPLAPLLPD